MFVLFVARLISAFSCGLREKRKAEVRAVEESSASAEKRMLETSGYGQHDGYENER